MDRRQFLNFIPAVGVALAANPASSIAAMRKVYSVGAIETLMRGHGLLLRAIIVFDTISDAIKKQQQADPKLILQVAEVFQDYLEAFHEKAEEVHIFAPLERANIEYDSIQELKVQHGSGFELTQRIKKLASAGNAGPELAGYLDDFSHMYRHHAAWEDTVIFPAFDALENREAMQNVAHAFASDEKSALGTSGFPSFLNKIADVEKHLGIYKLSTSTPSL